MYTRICLLKHFGSNKQYNAHMYIEQGTQTLVKLKHRNYLTSRNTIEYSAYKIINGCNTIGRGQNGIFEWGGGKVCALYQY